VYNFVIVYTCTRAHPYLHASVQFLFNIRHRSGGHPIWRDVSLLAIILQFRIL